MMNKTRRGKRTVTYWRCNDEHYHTTETAAQNCIDRGYRRPGTVARWVPWDINLKLFLRHRDGETLKTLGREIGRCTTTVDNRVREGEKYHRFVSFPINRQTSEIIDFEDYYLPSDRPCPRRAMLGWWFMMHEMWGFQAPDLTPRQ